MHQFYVYCSVNFTTLFFFIFINSFFLCLVFNSPLMSFIRESLTSSELPLCLRVCLLCHCYTTLWFMYYRGIQIYCSFTQQVEGFVFATTKRPLDGLIFGWMCRCLNKNLHAVCYWVTFIRWIKGLLFGSWLTHAFNMVGNILDVNKIEIPT